MAWRRISDKPLPEPMMATTTRARDSKHQSNNRHTKPTAGSQIDVTLYMNVKLIH